ncbi:MAG: ATP-binding cassette domain-containing protein [Chloroflexi bacterium]|nr:ATP-binding cassette domain-containing protein [Chloroflexota bacterium]
MSESVYQLNTLVKRYDSRTVVALDSLTVYRGEILALVGPSGAGKSTLLRLLGLLEAPTSGSLQFFGREVANGSAQADLELRRRLTMVFQRPLLLNRSVQANIAYGLRLRGDKSNGKVASAMEQLGLSHLARQNTRVLSGGEAQRVSLARAMVLDTEVLLLDEPTANLDPYNVNLIETAVRKMNAEQSKTIVLVTHNIFQAHRLAQRTALLLDGRLVEVSPSDVFFTAPADPRTAAFVRGDMVY